jgi:two-component system, chemotaxis family, chemotaxis protein CheY
LDVAYNFQKVKILIVESSPALSELLFSTLWLFTVPKQNIHCSSTMQDGFSQFCLTNHDLVLTDWLREPDSGIQLTRLIRSHEDSPNRFVPIIMTAGSGHKRSVLAARDAGVSEYLVLPFTAKELARKITRAIEFPRPFVASTSYTGPDRRIGSGSYGGPERRNGEQRRSA